MGYERIYIASDHPLPLIEFNAEAEDFYFWTGILDDEDGDVRKRFTKPHVYYVGSHMGCGCGFAYHSELYRAEFPGHTEEEYQEMYRRCILERYSEEQLHEFEMSNGDGRKSVQCLSDYLYAATEAGPVELYVRWGYDPVGEPKHRETVTPAYFGGPYFRLVHEALFTVQHASHRIRGMEAE